MKVEIWSDIVCPFCYIGKRNFEKALEKFEQKDDVEVIWRSFELSPGLKTDPSKSIYEFLAEKKGWTVDYSRDVHAQLTETAKNAGLDYNFDEAIVANSFNAHRLSHLAAMHGVQDEVEERLFSAYFTEGKNIDDDATLLQIGTEQGIPEAEIRKMLQSDDYRKQVEEDIEASRKVGVQGVPFFVVNEKYAVSGAQPEEAFLQVLQKVQEELAAEGQSESSTDAGFCTPGGDC